MIFTTAILFCAVRAQHKKTQKDSIHSDRKQRKSFIYWEAENIIFYIFTSQDLNKWCTIQSFFAPLPVFDADSVSKLERWLHRLPLNQNSVLFLTTGWSVSKPHVTVSLWQQKACFSCHIYERWLFLEVQLWWMNPAEWSRVRVKSEKLSEKLWDEEIRT